jgi:hypothetical protein
MRAPRRSVFSRSSSTPLLNVASAFDVGEGARGHARASSVGGMVNLSCMGAALATGLVYHVLLVYGVIRSYVLSSRKFQNMSFF